VLVKSQLIAAASGLVLRALMIAERIFLELSASVACHRASGLRVEAIASE
jgi:hypothetical protein